MSIKTRLIRTLAVMSTMCALFGGPLASVTRATGDEAEFRGEIRQLPASGLVGIWVVGDTTVHVSSTTEIDQERGPVVVGAIVEVKGAQLSDGSVDATEIKIEDNGDDDDDGDDGDDDELVGAIEQLPASGLVGLWVVASRQVAVGESTEIDQEHGQVALGVAVEVHGVPQPDGSLTATRIEVLTGDDTPTGGESSFYGVIEALPGGTLTGVWVVGGRAVRVSDTTVIDTEHCSVAVGALVEVEGVELADGSVDATRIEAKTNSSSGSSQSGFAQLKASVESLPDSGKSGLWLVGGRTVIVHTDTTIDQGNGQARVGARVDVRGNLLPGGALDAVFIQVKSKGKAGKAHWFGAIQALPASGLTGTWAVGSWTVVVSQSTRIEQELGAVKLGAYVEVYGSLRNDGSIAASKIEVKTGSLSASGAGYIDMKGIVEQLPAAGRTGEWNVSGRRVHVTMGTRIRERDGMLRVAAPVEVEGNQRTDGSIDATEISVKG